MLGPGDKFKDELGESKTDYSTTHNYSTENTKGFRLETPP
jgi:hypothetical protein